MAAQTHRRSADAVTGGSVCLDERTRCALEPFALELAGAARRGLGRRRDPYGDPAGHSWVAVAGPGKGRAAVT